MLCSQLTANKLSSNPLKGSKGARVPVWPWTIEDRRYGDECQNPYQFDRPTQRSEQSVALTACTSPIVVLPTAAYASEAGRDALPTPSSICVTDH
jgi:hypothetical protein